MEENRYHLITRFLDRQLSAAEKKELAQWRKAHPENEKRFQEIKFLWQKTPLAKQEEQALTIDVAAALAKVQQQLPQAAKVVPMRRRFFRITAAAVALLALGVFGWLTMQPSVEMIQIATVDKETKQITLPDESIVWLNENSTISYPAKFEQAARKITMSGNLVFEVSHNPAQPFMVTSDDLSVRVLGTKFNVQSDKDAKTASLVHVINGKVQVQKKDSPIDKVVLEKGMSVKLDVITNELAVSETFATNQLFWFNQTLSFNETAFQQVIVDINTAYDTQIIVSNPDLLACPVTGTFKEQNLEKILGNLQLIYGFEIEKITSQDLRLKNGTCQ